MPRRGRISWSTEQTNKVVVDGVAKILKRRYGDDLSCAPGRHLILFPPCLRKGVELSSPKSLVESVLSNSTVTKMIRAQAAQCYFPG
jgi:hypothetical protein